MAIKAQFNSSTLKSSYDAVGEKAQVAAFFDPPACHDCGRYTIVYSGVLPCAVNGGECPWPSDINTTFIAAYSSSAGDNHLFTVTQDGWTISLICNDANHSFELHSLDAADGDAFGAVWANQASYVPNDYDQLQCDAHDPCTLVIGKDGHAGLSWDNTGC